MREVPVVVGLTTFPPRTAALAQTIESLLPQVDRIGVYLNEYTTVPACLVHPKIEVAAVGGPDLGVAGKFYWPQRPDSYFFGCDDDMIYPPDYVARMVATVEKYDRKAIIGVHGHWFWPEMKSYYHDRHRVSAPTALAEDSPCNGLGSCAIAYHTSTITITPANFKTHNMGDVWLAVTAHEAHVPMIAIARPLNWIKCLPTPDTGIFGMWREQTHERARILMEHGPWPLFPVPPNSTKANPPRR